METQTFGLNMPALARVIMGRVGRGGRGGGKVVRFCKGGKETDDECEVF